MFIPELSIDVLQSKTTVSDGNLEVGLEGSDLPEIASYCDTTDGYVDMLELSAGEQTDVKTKAFVHGTMAGMLLALKYWVRKNGSKATFRALIVILLAFRKEDVAMKVCYYINRKCELLLIITDYN